MKQIKLFIRRSFNNVSYFLETLYWFIIPAAICIYFLKELKTWSVKQILIAYVLCAMYSNLRVLIKKWQRKPLSKDNAFNSVLAKEVMQIKLRLNELYDHNTPCFPKHDRSPDEMERKSFTKYWLAYHQYPEIAKLCSYKLPEDKCGAMIILLQTNGIKFYDPFFDIESFDERELINLNANRPQGYHFIHKLRVGDTVKAYIYDMEYWGFLEPSESEIKVISIEQPEYDHCRHITFEIDRKWNGFGFSGEKSGEPITRTIKYLEL